MNFAMIFAFFAALLVAVCALPSPGRVRLPPPRGGNPSFPGYGSFNPRGRRSVGDDPTPQVDINQ